MCRTPTFRKLLLEQRGEENVCKKKLKKHPISVTAEEEGLKSVKWCFLFHDIFISKLLKYHYVLAISFVIYVTSVLENCLTSKHMQIIKQVKLIGMI